MSGETAGVSIPANDWVEVPITEGATSVAISAPRGTGLIVCRADEKPAVSVWTGHPVADFKSETFTIDEGDVLFMRTMSMAPAVASVTS